MAFCRLSYPPLDAALTGRHEFAACVLIGLAVLPGLAALWHPVVRKNDILAA
ncbi:hypothetical protein [Rhizobium sp.]|jgi:hypothetical protein|uniref:hypothetical protein n=1 Tax=Rhizobium sp. TaxID=391 RepID=UPI002AA793C2